MSGTVESPGEARLERVGKVYSSGSRPEVVLRDCSFAVKPGELTVLIGPSGSGKSTIVKLLAGYEQPSVGKVTMDGRPVAGPSRERLLVFQETALLPWMSLRDNVAFGPIQSGLPRSKARAEAADLLKKVGLAGFGERFPHQVSGGMQRRAEVARALINKPSLLLLDEPFRGLDHMSRGLMQEYFVALFEEHGTTTLFVTSEVDEAIFLADRLVLLSYKPTAVKAEIEVGLPRPRQLQMMTSKIFADLKDYVLELLYAEALKGFVEGTATARDMKAVIGSARAAG